MVLAGTSFIRELPPFIGLRGRPAWQKERFLHERMEGLLQQRYPHFEAAHVYIEYYSSTSDSKRLAELEAQK